MRLSDEIFPSLCELFGLVDRLLLTEGFRLLRDVLIPDVFRKELFQAMDDRLAQMLDMALLCRHWL
jgi:hypothetical protein